jgi:hypothetical protein
MRYISTALPADAAEAVPEAEARIAVVWTLLGPARRELRRRWAGLFAGAVRNAPKGETLDDGASLLAGLFELPACYFLPLLPRQEGGRTRLPGHSAAWWRAVGWWSSFSESSRI